MPILEFDGTIPSQLSRASVIDRRGLVEGEDLLLRKEEEGGLDATPTKLRRKNLDDLLEERWTEEEGSDLEKVVVGKEELRTSSRLDDRGWKREVEG